VIAYDPRTRSLYVAPSDDMDPGERVPHLWLLEPDGSVRLVGVIDARKPATHNLPSVLAPDATRAVGFAVSLEPQGHTPTDTPGGPVVAKGDISIL
jgi:anti-sigma-K factor RskA